VQEKKEKIQIENTNKHRQKAEIISGDPERSYTVSLIDFKYKVCLLLFYHVVASCVSM
jgi:hypothetical protein